MACNSNHGVYNVKAIINLDPDILVFLDSDIGSTYERDESGDFVLLEEKN